MCPFIKPSLVTTTKKDLSSMGNNEEEEEAKISLPSAQPSPAVEKPVAQGAAHNSRTIATQSRMYFFEQSDSLVLCSSFIKAESSRIVVTCCCI